MSDGEKVESDIAWKGRGLNGQRERGFFVDEDGSESSNLKERMT